MKTFMVITFLLGLITNSYCQEDMGNEFVKDTSETEELSEVVIKRTGSVVSLYLPDKNPDINVRSLQEKFIAYNLGKDYEGFDGYFVTMESKDGVLTAHYNSKGKLIHVKENYKNVVLPSAVVYSVNKEFPGWELVDEKFLYSQKDGAVIKKQYSVKIKNERTTRKLVLRPDGEIIAGL